MHTTITQSNRPPDSSVVPIRHDITRQVMSSRAIAELTHFLLADLALPDGGPDSSGRVAGPVELNVTALLNWTDSNQYCLRRT